MIDAIPFSSTVYVVTLVIVACGVTYILDRYAKLPSRINRSLYAFFLPLLNVIDWYTARAMMKIDIELEYNPLIQFTFATSPSLEITWKLVIVSMLLFFVVLCKRTKSSVLFAVGVILLLCITSNVFTIYTSKDNFLLLFRLQHLVFNLF